MTEGPPGRRAKLSTRGIFAVIAGAGALIIAIAVAASSSGSDDSGRSTATTGTVAAPASTASAAATTAVGAPASTAPGIITTVAGDVTQVVDATTFVMNDGQTDYTILIAPTTKLVDFHGATMTAQDLVVAGLVQVTGTVDGSTITAQTILFPPPATSPPASAPSTETSQP